MRNPGGEQFEPQPPENEDALIRNILIGASTLALLGILGIITLIAIMISYNFNFLDWME